jgi:hypothetical protein
MREFAPRVHGVPLFRRGRECAHFVVSLRYVAVRRYAAMCPGGRGIRREWIKGVPPLRLESAWAMSLPNCVVANCRFQRVRR